MLSNILKFADNLLSFFIRLKVNVEFVLTGSFSFVLQLLIGCIFLSVTADWLYLQFFELANLIKKSNNANYLRYRTYLSNHYEDMVSQRNIAFGVETEFLKFHGSRPKVAAAGLCVFYLSDIILLQQISFAFFPRLKIHYAM